MTDKLYELDDKKVKEIESRKSKTSFSYPIDYKGKVSNFEIFEIDIECLNVRADNGRIASKVGKYRSQNAGQNPNEDWILDALYKQEKDKTDDLVRDLIRYGQRDPAVITADGKLVDGNRRRVAFHKIKTDKRYEDERFRRMKVCILPSDTANRPTERDILSLEYKYQSMTDGKAEWGQMDWAITMYLNNEKGFDYDAQIKQSPKLADTEFDDIKKEFYENKIDPIEIAVLYLEHWGRGSREDPTKNDYEMLEGRWTAFIELAKINKSIRKKWIENEGKSNFDEPEMDNLLVSFFSIIRLHNAIDAPKGSGVRPETYKLIREFKPTRAVMTDERAFQDIISIGEKVTENDLKNLPENDDQWVLNNKIDISSKLTSAFKRGTQTKVKETPLKLLEDALNKIRSANLAEIDFDGRPIGIATQHCEEILKKTNEKLDELKELQKQIEQSKE